MQQALRAMSFLVFSIGLSGPALAVDAQLLVYRVWEPGIDPYISRMLITTKFVRLDEGGAIEDGYTLYQRDSGAIYNVSDEEQTITVMRPTKDVPDSPVKLDLTKQVEEDKQAPAVGGVHPVRVKLLANGTVCRELMAVDGIMQPAVQGLKEFRESLAKIQGARLDAWPEESRTPCDLAELIYAPTRGLAHGVAVQDRTPTMSQSLVDFEKHYMAADELFVIPANYERIELPGL